MFGWNKKKKKKKKGHFSMRGAMALGLSKNYDEHMDWAIEPGEMELNHVETGALPIEGGLAVSLMMPFGESEKAPMDAPPQVITPQAGPDQQAAYEHFKMLLAQGWGINTPDDLLDVVSSLLGDPGDAEYEVLRPYMQQLADLPFEQRDDAVPQIIEAAVADLRDTEIPEDFLRERLEVCLDLYTQEHNEKLIPQKLPSTLAGWDIGRAARVARIGCIIGMIDLDQYLHISSAALALTREYSESWRDHVDQYLLGRAKWQEILDEETLDYRDMMWVRLNHPDSVWFKYPLHGDYRTEPNA